MKRRLSLDDIRSLSSDERVGDTPTHFFKSRHLLRNIKSSFFNQISKEIPNEWNGLPVVYDIWWDTCKERDNNGMPMLAGFSYTDFLSTCLYFKPTNSFLANMLLDNIVKNEVYIDNHVVDLINLKLNDKYKLSNVKNVSWPSEVVFLPGTNLLEKNYVNYDKVASVVANGAKVKPHPLTTKYHLEMLKHRFGASNIIDIEHNGYSYLSHCDKIYYCSNSELGFAALIQDKVIENVEVDRPDISFGGYKAIYNAIDMSKEKFFMLLSSDTSGLIVADDIKNVKKKLEKYLAGFSFFTRMYNETLD